MTSGRVSILGAYFRMRTHCRTVKQALSSLNSLWIYVKRVRSVYESKAKLEFIMPRPFSTPSFAQTCMSGQYTVSQEPGNKETRCKSSGAPVQNSKTGRIPGLLHGRLGVVDVVWQDALLGWQTHQGQPTPSCRCHKSEIPVRVGLYKSKASTLLPTILASLMVCVMLRCISCLTPNMVWLGHPQLRSRCLWRSFVVELSNPFAYWTKSPWLLLLCLFSRRNPRG